MIQKLKKDGNKMTVFCARHERDDYEDRRFYRSLPTHVPSVVFHTRVPVDLSDGTQEFVWKTVSTWDLFAGKRAVVFSLPGAFTPTCSTYQLPDFERLASEFLTDFDAIYCVSVNDSFVMNRWAKENDLQNIQVIPDGSHKFTDGMNMLVDKDNLGFGPRSWRYACFVENGEITDWFIEEGKEDNCDEDPYHYTSPEFLLASL